MLCDVCTSPTHSTSWASRLYCSTPTPPGSHPPTPPPLSSRLCSLNEVCQELDGRLLYGSAEDLDCGELSLNISQVLNQP